MESTIWLSAYTTAFCVTLNDFFIGFLCLFFFFSNELGYTVLEGKFKYPAIPKNWHVTLKKVEDYVKICSGIHLTSVWSKEGKNSDRITFFFFSLIEQNKTEPSPAQQVNFVKPSHLSKWESKRTNSVLEPVQNTFYMYVNFGGDKTGNVISALSASLLWWYWQLSSICPILSSKEEGDFANTDI